MCMFHIIGPTVLNFYWATLCPVSISIMLIMLAVVVFALLSGICRSSACSCCSLRSAEPRELALIKLLDASVPTGTTALLGWHVQSDVMHCLRHTVRYKRWADVFCGTGGLSAAFVRRHSRSPASGISLDLSISSAHNILEDSGFALCIQSVLELVPMAIAVIGLPCSTFVFMSRGTTKRFAENAWLGDEAVECVRAANIIANRIVLLCKLLTLRLVQYMIEQPMTSCFFNMRCFRNCHAMKPHLGRHGLHLARKFVWLGHWVHTIPKPTMLWGSARALKYLVCRKPKSVPGASDSVVRKGSLRWIKVGINGEWIQRRRVSGIHKKLKLSQVYPRAFCNTIARYSLISPMR